MKAARIHHFGDSRDTLIENIEIPKPHDGQVLIRVLAACINPYDISVINGRAVSTSAVNFPFTVGQDFAGTIEKIGKGVDRYHTGEKVIGSSSALFGGSGACAEYVVADASKIAASTSAIDDIHAASLPTAGSTALAAINNLHIVAKDKLYIHGGAGGVGTFAIQIAKSKGAYVCATASAENRDFVISLGANEAIDYKKENYAQQLRDYDALLNAATTYPSELIPILKRGGRAVSLTEPFNEHISLRHGIEAVLQSTNITHALLADVVTLVDQALVIPQIYRVYKLDDIAGAFEALEHESIRGKIVIKISDY
jgi:NADPH:quinone reductase-like Zn-dependent oxidoreductase